MEDTYNFGAQILGGLEGGCEIGTRAGFLNASGGAGHECGVGAQAVGVADDAATEVSRSRAGDGAV